ncbi:hypothetical protein OIU76_007924 [Salix suchowensis]|nr:hypothetical protein OIU76_007924 [Salix suchowensis]
MNHKGDKFVRFQDCSSEKSFSSEQRYSIEDGFYARKAKPTFNAVWDNIRRGWEMGSERIRSLKNPSRFNPRGARSVKEQGPKKKILDPQGASWLRILKLLPKNTSPLTLIVDILSILPLPQAVLTIILPSVVGPVSLAAKNLLELVIFTQYIPRLVRIYPLFKEITSTSGILTETAWAGAVFNLFLYMLASHIIGAFWYLFSIEREDSCWREACKGHGRCDSLYWYCGNHRRENHTFLTESCPFIHPDQIQNSTVFNFGIFIDALDSGVVGINLFSAEILLLLLVGFAQSQVWGYMAV